MNSVMSFLCLVPFPFTDQTTTKKRPAVVVSSEKYNSGRPDLIIMAITSRMHQLDKLGEKLVADWQGSGERHQGIRIHGIPDIGSALTDVNTDPVYSRTISKY